MNKSRRTCLSLGLLFLSLSFTLVSHAEPISFFNAYEQARQYDAQYQAAEAGNLGNKEEINKAKAAFLPKIQFSAAKGRGKTDSTTPFATQSSTRGYDTQNYNLSLRQPLFNMQALAEYRQAEASVAKSDALLAVESVNLISRLTDAYFNVLFTEDNLRYTASRKITATDQLQQAKRRFQTGAGTITEIDEVQASLDLIQAQLIELKNNDSLNRGNLENIIGVYPDELFKLAADKVVMQIPDPQEADAWIKKALESNAEILVARQQVEVATQQIERSRAGHYPTLDLVASRSYTESENNITIGSTYDTTSLSVQLNVPIFSGGFVNASVRQAIAAQEESKEQMNLKLRQVKADVRGFYNGMANAISSTQAYQQAEKSSQAALVGTKKGFEFGTRTNVDVLNAQEKLFESQRNLAKARYQFVTNLIKLKESTGQLNAQDIEQVSGWFVKTATQE